MINFDELAKNDIFLSGLVNWLTLIDKDLNLSRMLLPNLEFKKIIKLVKYLDNEDLIKILEENDNDKIYRSMFEKFGELFEETLKGEIFGFLLFDYKNIEEKNNNFKIIGLIQILLVYVIAINDEFLVDKFFNNIHNIENMDEQNIIKNFVTNIVEIFNKPNPNKEKDNDDEIKDRFEEYERKINNLNEENMYLKNELKNKNEKILNLDFQKDNLCREIEEMSNFFNQDNDNTKDKYKEIIENLKTSKKKKEIELNFQIEELSDNNKILTTQNEENILLISKLKKKETELKNKLKNYYENYIEKSKLVIIKERNSNLEMVNFKIENSLLAEKSLNSGLKDQIKKLEIKNKKKIDSITKIESQKYDDIRKRYNKLQKKFSKLETDKENNELFYKKSLKQSQIRISNLSVFEESRLSGLVSSKTESGFLKQYETFQKEFEKLKNQTYIEKKILNDKIKYLNEKNLELKKLLKSEGSLKSIFKSNKSNELKMSSKKNLDFSKDFLNKMVYLEKKNFVLENQNNILKLDLNNRELRNESERGIFYSIILEMDK